MELTREANQSLQQTKPPDTSPACAGAAPAVFAAEAWCYALKEVLVLSFEEFQSIVQRLNAALSDFLAVDRELANCGLKPYDFSQSTARLEDIGSRTKALREELLEHSAQSKDNPALQITMAYMDRLLASQQQLSTISSRLAAKAEGKGYGIFAYGRDMRAYKKCESSRLALGPQLNVVVHQPW